MGYNLFNIKEVQGTSLRKLHDFRESLGSAIGEGKDIPFADKDINYSIMLQNERLKEKGLELDYNIYSRDENSKKFIAGSSWKDAHYESTVCFSPCGIKRKIKKDGKQRFKDDRKSVLYETVTDVVTGAHPDDDPFCCPNCGTVSTVAGLTNGCPYCGTKFQMDDLFPKVTSYFFLEDAGMTKDEFKKGYLICYAVSLVTLYILGGILNKDFLPWNLIKSIPNLLYVLIGFPLVNIVSAYIFYAYYLIFRLIIKAILSTGKMGTAGSRLKFENRMKKICPEFSYEYFTSKAVSLIKTAVFSKNEQELLFYTGGPMNPKMKNIIDLNYGGALGCGKFKDEGNFVTVVTKAYFDVLYAEGNRIYSRSQVFSATFQRRTDVPINLNFSMTKISCPTCGSSYDATKNKICPYCGNEYEITTDDWALVELKYM